MTLILRPTHRVIQLVGVEFSNDDDDDDGDGDDVDDDDDD